MDLRTNRLKAEMRDGKLSLGCSLHESRDPAMVQAIAAAGADVVFIDLEHHGHSIETALDLAGHAHGAGITPLVRPPQVDYAWITRLLDGGCQSLLIPHLRLPSEVEQLLELAQYPPVGRRGVALYGGAGVNFQAVDDAATAMAWANQQLLLGLVIETPEAVDNLDSMIVSGVDLAVVGRGDLAVAFGVPGDIDHPLVEEVSNATRQLCKTKGIAYGVFEARPKQVPSELEAEPLLLIAGGVFSFVRQGVIEMRALIDDHPRSASSTGVPR